MELVDTGAYTAARVDAAVELTARLPRTLAGMAGGTDRPGQSVRDRVAYPRHERRGCRLRR